MPVSLNEPLGALQVCAFVSLMCLSNFLFCFYTVYIHVSVFFIYHCNKLIESKHKQSMNHICMYYHF